MRAEVKTAGEAVVEDYKANFDKTPEYDDFANFWASWAAQEVMSRLRESYPGLDLGPIEEEFGGPTGGRPAAEEPAEEGEEAPLEEVGEGAIVNVD